MIRYFYADSNQTHESVGISHFATEVLFLFFNKLFICPYDHKLATAPNQTELINKWNTANKLWLLF